MMIFLPHKSRQVRLLATACVIKTQDVLHFIGIMISQNAKSGRLQMESREMETMLGLVELRVTNQLVLTIQSKLVNADSQMVQCSQPIIVSTQME